MNENETISKSQKNTKKDFSVKFPIMFYPQ